MMDTALVAFVVLLAATFLVRKFSKPLRGKGAACGCGTCSCDTPGKGAPAPDKSGGKIAAKPAGKLIPFKPAPSGGGCGSAACTCKKDEDVPTTRLQ